MTDEIDRRDYGRLEAQVEQLTKDVHSMKATMDTMRDLRQTAVGGWKLLLMLGGAAAAAGAFISWVASHLTIK